MTEDELVGYLRDPDNDALAVAHSLVTQFIDVTKHSIDESHNTTTTVSDLVGLIKEIRNPLDFYVIIMELAGLVSSLLTAVAFEDGQDPEKIWQLFLAKRYQEFSR